ncbi:hypothetical protein HY572_01525 [Candidatus Micrarchaeota archaeon]|nr:hypothetical protein [Candidatus Micrarchaeota archaeon]
MAEPFARVNLTVPARTGENPDEKSLLSFSQVKAWKKRFESVLVPWVHGAPLVRVFAGGPHAVVLSARLPPNGLREQYQRILDGVRPHLRHEVLLADPIPF